MTAANPRFNGADVYPLPASWIPLGGAQRLLEDFRTWPILTTAISIVTDLAGCFAATLLVAVMNPGRFAGTGYLPLHQWLIALLLVPVYAGLKLYPPVGLKRSEEVWRVVLATAIVYTSAAGVCVIWTGGRVPLDTFLVGGVIATSLVLIARLGFRAVLSRLGWWGFPAIVIGDGTRARRTVRTLQHHSWLGLKPVAVIDGDAPRGRRTVRGVPIIGHVASAPWEDPVVARRYTALSVAGMGGATVIRPQLQVSLGPMVKRAVDFGLAAVIALLTLPVIAVLAVLVKIDSQGPIFYGHKRIGQGGSRFKAWKFRSMVSNADQVLDHYLDAHPEYRQEWERDHKLKDDPRITRMGRFLRKTSLDELPQIWNVLTGEMSLVGPRPIVEAEIPRYGDKFDLFVSVKPGITGLWQVSGRNNTTYEQRVALDIHYVRHWSPWLDARILARTVPVVLVGYGAY